VVLLCDAANSGGSVYFDDLNLGLTSATPYGDWNIVWSDEFNGPAIDTNTWTYDTRPAVGQQRVGILHEPDE
jgi:hypothetical protein